MVKFLFILSTNICIEFMPFYLLTTGNTILIEEFKQINS